MKCFQVVCINDDLELVVINLLDTVVQTFLTLDRTSAISVSHIVCLRVNCL